MLGNYLLFIDVNNILEDVFTVSLVIPVIYTGIIT